MKTKSRIAVFPGSFDPITKGHENIVRRAIPLFDKIIVAVGHNSEKRSVFTIEERIRFIQETFADAPSVAVEAYSGLTVDFCKKNKADFLLRGIRNASDFEFEKNIAITNKDLMPGLETLFLFADPQYDHISSTLVREIIRHKRNVENFLPKKLKEKT